MKRLLLSIILPAVLLLAGGCGTAGEETPDPTFTPTPTEEIAVIGAADNRTPVPSALPSPAPSPTPDPALGPVPETFSIVWVSDTQHYIEIRPEMLTAMTKWVTDHRGEYNIKALVHTGDMVNRSGSTRQWENIGAALDGLGDLPLLALAGNHDVGTATLDYSYFIRHVASRYPRPDQLYEQGRGSWLELPMAYENFLLVGIGWGYKDGAVAWLKDVIKAHPLDMVILCCHSYLDSNGSLTDGGDILFEQAVKPYHSVRLVLSGHRDGTGLRTDALDDNRDGVVDRNVCALLYNYQEVDKDDGGGYLRLLTVDPGKRTLRVRTYSPYLDDWKTGEKEDFTLTDVF